MLRFYCKLFLKSTFPFIPQPWLQDLMVKKAKMRFNDTSAMQKLYDHLTKCAHKNIMALPKEQRRFLQKCKKDPHEQYINLKELRDQMLGHRCSNGKLFMYGMANEGRLGVRLGGGENALPDQAVFKAQLRGLQLVQFPEEVFNQGSAPVQIIKVECSSSFTIALSSQGYLYSWGLGKSGSLGLGETSYSETPVRIEKLHGDRPCVNMTDISSGSSHSLAVDIDGRIYSWGNGQGGRLGHNQEVGENAPR